MMHGKRTPFLNRDEWIEENAHAAALPDKYPVASGHILVVPKRVVASIFELSPEELACCWDLVSKVRSRIVGACNVGVNDGADAGQTVSHAHIHVIPRTAGDHPDPRGGVRAVIPGMALYESLADEGQPTEKNGGTT